MALFEQFPYTNFHGVNLGWILQTVKENSETVNSFDGRLSNAESGISAATSAASAAVAEANSATAKVGPLAQLQTSAKNNLVAAINELAEGGGHGAPDSYISLTDKPQINDVSLIGNRTTADLGISYTDLTGKPSINGVSLTGNKTTSDLGISYSALTNRPQINGVTLAGNKTTANLGISYNDISNHPMINGNELTGDKTNAQLGITYNNLADKPIPPVLNFGIGATSKKINLASDRACLMIVGSYQANNGYVVAFLQAYRLGTSTFRYNVTELTGSANTHITFVGGTDDYSFTVSNDTANVFSCNIFVLQGSVASIT